MTGLKLVGMGFILIFSMPGIVAASDGRRTHTLFHIALGFCGLCWSFISGGLYALILSFLSGVLVLALLTLSVAFTQRRWSKRILVGGEMKLMTAAATWLPPISAIGAVALAVGAVVLWLIARTSLQNDPSRPDVTPFIIGSLLLIFTIS
jgi:hypothetical protein